MTNAHPRLTRAALSFLLVSPRGHVHPVHSHGPRRGCGRDGGRADRGLRTGDRVLRRRRQSHPLPAASTTTSRMRLLGPRRWSVELLDVRDNRQSRELHGLRCLLGPLPLTYHPETGNREIWIGRKQPLRHGMGQEACLASLAFASAAAAQTGAITGRVTDAASGRTACALTAGPGGPRRRLPGGSTTSIRTPSSGSRSS